MSNKPSKTNLLNESQVRQFMKLAQLEPLTPGFIGGLGERRETRPPGQAGSSTHGRSDKPVPNSKLMREVEADPEALDDYAAGDEERGEPEEAEVDELEAGDEEVGDLEGEDEGRMVSVDDFLAALESALETAMGDEVEVDASAMEDEEDAGDDLEAADDMEVDADVDLEMDDEMLDEEQGAVDKEDEHLGAKDGAERGKKQSMKDRRKEMRGKARAEGDDAAAVEEGVFGGKSAADKAREKLALGKKDSYAPDAEAGEKDYTPTPEEAAKARAHAKANPTSSRDKFPRRRSGGGGGMKIGGITSESQDELVEQITKRVAARILKSALAKK